MQSHVHDQFKCMNVQTRSLCVNALLLHIMSACTSNNNNFYAIISKWDQNFHQTLNQRCCCNISLICSFDILAIRRMMVVPLSSATGPYITRPVHLDVTGSKLHNAPCHSCIASSNPFWRHLDNQWTRFLPPGLSSLFHLQTNKVDFITALIIPPARPPLRKLHGKRHRVPSIVKPPRSAHLAPLSTRQGLLDGQFSSPPTFYSSLSTPRPISHPWNVQSCLQMDDGYERLPDSNDSNNRGKQFPRFL